MGSSKIQRALWGKKAQDWTELQEPNHKPLWLAMMQSVAVGEGTTFLDVGCGGGGASILAAELGAKVNGIDATPELIELAAERETNGDFQVSDMENLPYEDGQFDVVFAANAVQYAEDRVAAVREFKRVCALTGRVVAGLFGPPGQVEFRTIFQAVRDAMPEPPPGAGPFELSAPGILESMLENGGLNIVESSEVDCPFSYPDLATFWQATVSGGPFQGLLQTAGEDLLRSAVEASVERFHMDDGSILIKPNIFRYVVAKV